MVDACLDMTRQVNLGKTSKIFTKIFYLNQIIRFDGVFFVFSVLTLLPEPTVTFIICLFKQKNKMVKQVNKVIQIVEQG